VAQTSLAREQQKKQEAKQEAIGIYNCKKKSLPFFRRPKKKISPSVMFCSVLKLSYLILSSFLDDKLTDCPLPNPRSGSL